MSKPRQAEPANDPLRFVHPMRAAAILGISTDALRKWCSEGKHPALEDAAIRLPSGHYRYVEAKVRAYAKRMGKVA